MYFFTDRVSRLIDSPMVDWQSHGWLTFVNTRTLQHTEQYFNKTWCPDYRCRFCRSHINTDTSVFQSRIKWQRPWAEEISKNADDKCRVPLLSEFNVTSQTQPKNTRRLHFSQFTPKPPNILLHLTRNSRVRLKITSKCLETFAYSSI